MLPIDLIPSAVLPPKATINVNSCGNINAKTPCGKKRNNYLQIEVIRKMITRLLTEQHLSEESLAQALGITVKSLRQLYATDPQLVLIAKINLPLVKLYCATKFHN